MSEKEKLAMLEEVLDMDEGSLQPDMILDDLDEYDSLTKLSIIVLIEDNFGKRLNAKDFKEFRIVSDILKVMEE